MKDKKVMMGAYVPTEVRDFLVKEGKKFYPILRPSTMVAKILIEWCLAKGMKGATK
jgi:hypothetical protein